MNLYRQMKRKQQKEIDEYLSKYAFFAFSEKQYEAGLKELGADPGSLTRIPGGGFIRSDKAKGLLDLLSNNRQEREAALRDSETGSQFAFDMFYAELADHEYSYTGDPAEALEALNLTEESLQADPVLKTAFDKAILKMA